MNSINRKRNLTKWKTLAQYYYLETSVSEAYPGDIETCNNTNVIRNKKTIEKH